MFLSWQLCFLLSVAVGFSSALRILGFVVYPATSHHNAIAPILHGLAAKGHDVVYVTPVQPRAEHPNLEVRKIKPYIKEYLEELNLTQLGSLPLPMAAYRFHSTAVKLADYYYGDPVAQAVIQGTEKFDAVIIESYFTQEPVSALMHKFGCVGIEVSTMGDLAWVNELSGLPDNPAYQVDFKSGLTDNLNYFQRLYNFYSLWGSVLVDYYHLYRMQAIMDKYFRYPGWETRPSIFQLVSNRSMVLINQDVLLGYAYPTAPHVKAIGGLNLYPNQPLPKDLQKWMDEAPNGVILFSMGSNLKTSEISSSHIGKAFLKLFEEIPQRIILKWESDTPPEFLRKLKNVKTSTWLPQQDILAHQNCVLFITHGGYQSLTESIYYGVPLVGIPFFADQPKNMLQVEQAGYGLMLRKENVTYEAAKWAVNEVMNNPKYKKEAMRRAEMMRERRHTGLEDAVYWVEHAIKYPNSLTPRAAFLSFVALHNIDIYATLAVVIYILYKIISLPFRTTNKSKSRKEKLKRT